MAARPAAGGPARWEGAFEDAAASVTEAGETEGWNQPTDRTPGGQPADAALSLGALPREATQAEWARGSESILYSERDTGPIFRSQENKFKGVDTDGK